MNGSRVSEKFQAERSLSYIIENDQDYGSKLSKLLAHNSSGVPMLGINNIRFHEKMDDNVAEMEFLMEEFISKSKILDGSEMKFYAYSSIESLLEFEEPRNHMYAPQDDDPTEPNENQDAIQEDDELEQDKIEGIDNIDSSNKDQYECSRPDGDFSESELVSEEKDAELEECMQIVDAEEPDTHETPSSGSNPLNVYFDNIYEKSFGCFSKILNFEQDNKVPIDEDHLDHTPDSSEDIGLKNEDSRIKAVLSESKSEPRFELEIKSKPEPKLELELELELDESIKTNASVYVPENTETLRLTTEERPTINKEAYIRDQAESDTLTISSEKEWKMRIESMMSREKNSHVANYYTANTAKSVASSYLEGSENHGYSSNLNLRDSIQGNNACTGTADCKASKITAGLSGTAKLPSLLSTKDLKIGVIREIEYELRGCKFSLNADREAQNQTKGTDSLDPEGGKPISSFSRGQELNLELDLSLAAEQDQDFSTDSEYETLPDLNKTLVHQGSVLAHQIAEARPPPQYSSIDLNYHSGTFLFEEDKPKLEMLPLGKTAHSLANTKAHTNRRETKLLDVSPPNPKEAPNKEMSLWDLGGLKNGDHRSQLADTVDLEQTLNLSCGAGGATGQSAMTKTPESVIMAIKLLGIVRDIKRQIKLIKRPA